MSSVWDWMRLLISPMTWLLHLFRSRNNENSQAQVFPKNGNIRRTKEQDNLLKEKEKEVKKLRMEYNQLLTRNKSLEKLSKESEQTLVSLKKENSKLQSRNEDLKRQNSKHEQEVITLKRDCSQLRTRNEDLSRKLNENQQQVDTLKKDCSQLQTSADDHKIVNVKYDENYVNGHVTRLRTLYAEKMMSSRVDEIEEDRLLFGKRSCKGSYLRTRRNLISCEAMAIHYLEDLSRQLNENEQQADTLKKDCNQLRTRLSQIAAMQLTEGNPNIANLSDQNRPDKLAEQFSELYDNQWTDCYQILIGHLKKTEEESIHILLQIVQVLDEFKQSLLYSISTVKKPNQASKSFASYDICIDRSQIVLTAAKDILFAFAGTSDGEHDKAFDIFIQETLHKLKSYRNKNFKSASTKIGQEIKVKLISTIGEPVVDACSCFIEECIKICWLMCIKDPPMYIFCNKEAGFDKNKYMEYTEKGQEVSYVVWPVLYLHKNGPLMRKGVAQGEGRKERERNREVNAANRVSPGPSPTQEYYPDSVDSMTLDGDHQTKDPFITKENKSDDMANADDHLSPSTMVVMTNRDKGNADKLGCVDDTKREHTGEEEAMRLQCIDDAGRGQDKGTKIPPIGNMKTGNEKRQLKEDKCKPDKGSHTATRKRKKGTKKNKHGYSPY